MPTYRGNGAWGAGKGANLTEAEFDGNTHEFDVRITTLEEAEGDALSVTNVSMSGSQLTLAFSDGSSFTVTVPRATGFDPFAVASLPASPATGRHAFATDGRRSGEGAGAGSGCPVYYDGADWRTFFDNSVVAD